MLLIALCYLGYLGVPRDVYTVYIPLGFGWEIKVLLMSNAFLRKFKFWLMDDTTKRVPMVYTKTPRHTAAVLM